MGYKLLWFGNGHKTEKNLKKVYFEVLKNLKKVYICGVKNLKKVKIS